MRDDKLGLGRRDFLKRGFQAAASAAVLGSGLAQAAIPKEKSIALAGGLPTRRFGKTGHVLPVLGHGGSAMVERFIRAYGLELIPEEERINMVRAGYDQGIRYFDTARVYGESERIMGKALKGVRDNVYIASKVAVSTPDQVRRSVETTLSELGTDYVDCMQVHSPVIERAGFDGGMKVHAELVKLREEGMIRFIGLTTHVVFEDVYKMIDTGGFDQVLLAYCYFPRSMNGVLSNPKIEWRNRCLARAHELGMGIVAMKVLGANLMNHNSKALAPEYDDDTRRRLAAAAIRWVLSDERVCVLNVGVSFPRDIEMNLATLKGETALTSADRALLAEFTVKAYNTQLVKALPLD